MYSNHPNQGMSKRRLLFEQGKRGNREKTPRLLSLPEPVPCCVCESKMTLRESEGWCKCKLCHSMFHAGPCGKKSAAWVEVQHGLSRVHPLPAVIVKGPLCRNCEVVRQDGTPANTNNKQLARTPTTPFPPTPMGATPRTTNPV